MIKYANCSYYRNQTPHGRGKVRLDGIRRPANLFKHNDASKNIYIYIHEMEGENVRKLAPTVLIDWTMIPDRTEPVKKVIMKALHDKLAEIEPDLQDEIVIIFNDIPLSCAMLGGETRSDNPDK